MKVVTSAEMRRAEERAAAAGIGTAELMAHAGLAVAEAARSEMGGAAGRRVTVLVGPGNNGGDGLVAARHLRRWGADVFVYFATPRRQPDDLVSACIDAGCVMATAEDDDPDASRLAETLQETDLVVDAVLGTGRTRPLEGVMARTLTRVREERERRTPGAGPFLILAVDTPTGLDADTGELDPLTLAADVTIALGILKRGHLAIPGAEACGRTVLVKIGLPAESDAGAHLELIDSAFTRASLPERPLGGHKGSFGRVLVVGGSPNYLGAPALAARAAGRAGAGLVTVAAPASLTPSIAALCAEATHLPLHHKGNAGHLGPQAADELLLAPRHDAMLIGPGMGHSSSTAAFLQTVLFGRDERQDDAPTPLVLDADALNILAAVPGWWRRLSSPASTVLTPHPGEMSRLTGLSTEEVQADRLGITQARAKEWGVVVVLKGAFTVVADPQGPVAISPIALASLASAGTGDVLSGLLAGLLAQGVDTFEAACAAVYLHGLAGALASREKGDDRAGLLAGDVAERVPAAMGMVRRGEPVPFVA